MPWCPLLTTRLTSRHWEKISDLTGTAQPPKLEGNEVHLYLCPLTKTGKHNTIWLQANTLAPEELTQASRFYRPHHAQRFTISRLALRAILSFYCRTPTETISFQYNRFGKPFLSPSCGQSGLFFNLSRSDDFALLAISKKEVGVDIEQARPMPDVLDLAQLVLSSHEYQRMATAATEDQTALFSWLWTRKEACLKATGLGFSYPPEACQVCVPTQNAMVTLPPYPPYTSQGFSLGLRSFFVKPNLFIALAAQETFPEVSFFTI